MSRPDWRIYYSDGTTFDSTQGTPADAPSYGFVCAIGYGEDGKRYIMHGWDWYRWDNESKQWWGHDIHGLLDHLLMNNVYAAKQGRTLTKTAFQKMMDAAHDDPDFPYGSTR